MSAQRRLNTTIVGRPADPCSDGETQGPPNARRRALVEQMVHQRILPTLLRRRDSGALPQRQRTGPAE